MLRAFVNETHDDWDTLLPTCEFAYNSTVSVTGRLRIEKDRFEIVLISNPILISFMSKSKNILVVITSST